MEVGFDRFVFIAGQQPITYSIVMVALVPLESTASNACRFLTLCRTEANRNEARVAKISVLD